MLRLILARHAEYNYDTGKLTDTGKGNARALGRAIRSHLQRQGIEQDPHLFSSDAVRVCQTASRIGLAFRSIVKGKPALDLDCRSFFNDLYSPRESRMPNNHYRYHENGVLQGVGKHMPKGCEVVICVTHAGNLQQFGQDLLPDEVLCGYEWNYFLKSQGDAVLLEFDAESWAEVSQADRLELIYG